MISLSAAKWVQFLRQYGPIPRNDIMYDEHTRKSAKRAGIRPLAFTHPIEPQALPLFSPDCDRPTSVTARLEQLVAEMNARYATFRAVRSANLNDYNAKVSERDRLPVVWVIHDEFAEWMMVDEYKDAVTSTVGRLGVKARAAGIHLVFAAQRPDANVMPMQLRANLGNRLILKVDSAGTSEIALGEPGAEWLLGYGHLLAKLEGSPGLCFAQVPYVDASLVERIVQLANG